MAYNSLSIIGQRPYIMNNNFIQRKNSDEESNASSSLNEHNENITDKQKKSQLDVQEQIQESKDAQKRAIASRDANLKNATINIAQILKDFRGTIKAIGTPPELAEEVLSYLNLIETQVKKETPDTKLIRSNLKNASTLLDNYISQTLQRDSKVVENWIDALFLQQVNYKYNDGEVNSQFLVKFPQHKDKEENSEEEENSENNDNNETEKTQAIIPTDEKLKKLFISAKKYTYTKEYAKAMQIFKQALSRAQAIEDCETESKILFEIGKIYDTNDYLAQALTSYEKSLKTTKDINVKTKAHYSMAQIYDDVAQFESAINHYLSSISYAGENENLTAQATSLVKIGNIYSDEYKNEAFDFLNEAEILANQTKNSRTKGYVTCSIANTYNKFNKPKDALSYYSQAVKNYDDAKMPEKVAINYKRAGELMNDYNNNEKAQKLFRKALSNARKTDNLKLMKDIHDTLSMS